MLVKPKDCAELAPTKVIMRYTKWPTDSITIGSVDIVMPTAHADTTVGVGPNHHDVTTAGDKVSSKSVGVFFVLNLRFPTVGCHVASALTMNMISERRRDMRGDVGG
jgi:hypothetical protein